MDLQQQVMLSLQPACPGSSSFIAGTDRKDEHTLVSDHKMRLDSKLQRSQQRVVYSSQVKHGSRELDARSESLTAEILQNVAHDQTVSSKNRDLY